jgi:hypothetical protein
MSQGEFRFLPTTNPTRPKKLFGDVVIESLGEGTHNVGGGVLKFNIFFLLVEYMTFLFFRPE